MQVPYCNLSQTEFTQDTKATQLYAMIYYLMKSQGDGANITKG